MNKQQEHLLKLIKEIDVICKKYDITYYCAGGTVIGAARHKGFIPWDDDIDIYMTRENFDRFEQAFCREKPVGRVLEHNMTNRDYHSVIPRYMEEDTAMFSQFDMIGHAAAGVLIDIFILDPVPGDRQSKESLMAKMNIYNDIILPFYVFSHRMRDDDLVLWEEYQKKIDTLGSDAVLKELESDLFSYEEDECDTLMLRWGSLINFFPKDMMGEPVYMQFEDIELPMPERWYDYLVHLYGSDWMNVPFIESQGEHNNIKSYDHSYKLYYEERDRLFSQTELEEMYHERKFWRIELEKNLRPIETYIFDLKSSICNAILDKKIALLNEASSSEDIIEAFKEYIEMQTSRPFIGRMIHSFYYRWMHPYIIPISDDYMSLLFSALFDSGKIALADKIIRLYKKAGKTCSVTDKANRQIRILDEISKTYYFGDYQNCIKLADECDEEIIKSRALDFKKMAMAKLHPCKELADKLETDSLNEPENIYVKKAYADTLYELNDNRYEIIYNEILDNSRNGLFWLDINSKISAREMVYTKPSEFVSSSMTDLHANMLKEFAEICDENNIKYVLSEMLSKRMVQFGNIGYENANKTIFMDADNANRLIQVFKKKNMPNRSLLSWLNDDTISDFVLLYSDNNSIRVNFKKLEESRGRGLYLKIIILRSGYAKQIYKRNSFYREFIVNLRHMEMKDKRLLGNFKKNVLFKMVSAGKNDGSFERKLFKDNMKNEIRAKKGQFYYIKNTRGKRPERKAYSDSSWFNTTLYNMDGYDYSIPVSVKAGFDNRAIKSANKKKELTLFQFYSSDLSWDELEKLINWTEYQKLDWESYEVSFVNLKRMNKRAKKVWNIMLRFEDMRLLAPEYSGSHDEIRKAVDSGNNELAFEMLREYDIKVKEYNKKGLTFIIDNDLNDIYLKYLSNTGQMKLKSQIINKMTDSGNNYM